jgi:hypothetical protein
MKSTDLRTSGGRVELPYQVRKLRTENTPLPAKRWRYLGWEIREARGRERKEELRNRRNGCVRARKPYKLGRVLRSALVGQR